MGKHRVAKARLKSYYAFSILFFFVMTGLILVWKSDMTQNDKAGIIALSFPLAIAVYYAIYSIIWGKITRTYLNCMCDRRIRAFETANRLLSELKWKEATPYLLTIMGIETRNRTILKEIWRLVGYWQALRKASHSN